MGGRSWLIKSAAGIKEGSVSGLIIERNLAVLLRVIGSNCIALRTSFVFRR